VTQTADVEVKRASSGESETPGRVTPGRSNKIIPMRIASRKLPATRRAVATARSANGGRARSVTPRRFAEGLPRTFMWRRVFE
jgi:hypothetical protein